jgi:hypothetical protein
MPRLSFSIFVLLAALSYYYCFTVMGGMSNERFAQRYEPFFHVGVVVVALSVAIFGLFYDDIYNPKRSGLGCWVGPYPSDCQEGPEECERGDNASARLVQLVGSIAPSSFSLLSMIINNVILYGNMRRLEARNRRYTSHFQQRATTTAVAPNNNNSSNNNNKNNNPSPWRRLSLAGLRSSAAGLFRTSTTTTTSTNADQPAPPPSPKPVSRRMAVQSFCYVGAFWMSYGWGFVHFALLSFANKNYFALQAIGFFFYPAQGFLNAVVYLRPNYLRWRDAGESRLDAVKHALFSLQAPRRRPGPSPHATVPPRRPPVQDLTDGSNTEDNEAQKYAKPKEDEDIEESMVSSDSFSSLGGDDDNPQHREREEPPSKSAADLA